MLIRSFDDGVRVLAPAKVNLFLEVLGKRGDGYHDLGTLMVAVNLYDSLEVRAAAHDEVRLECDLPGLSTGQDNLVVRAALLLRERFGVRAGADIRLSKRIPLGGGLGGGSSDAAATLAALNRLWRLGQDAHRLGALGAELGSDVTFFFFGPAAWCAGRGEIVTPLRISRPFDLVLACPPVGLSTASVFKALVPPEQTLDGSAVRSALESGDVSALGRAMFNRLEAPAMRLCPEVARLRRRLEALAPAGVMMSGSGSTVFALTDGPAEASRISRALLAEREVGDGTRVHVVSVAI